MTNQNPDYINPDTFDPSDDGRDEEQVDIFLMCEVCKRYDDEYDMVNCSVCSKDFHVKCIEKDGEEVNDSFKCETCTAPKN